MTAHEALGLLLLELGRPSEAFDSFEASLRTSKNRLRSYAGAAAAAAAVGNTSAVRSYYTKLVELADGGTRPELASQGLPATDERIAPARRDPEEWSGGARSREPIPLG
jgi:hypothetical protein